MAEFSAAAELSVSVAQGDLSRLRSEIERELSDIEVGVSGSAAPTGGAVGARGPEPATVDLSRRQLGEQETLVELARERNEILEEGIGGGGGGFGRGALAGAGGVGAAGVLGGVGGAAGLLGGIGSVLGIGRLLSDPEAARQGRQVPGGRSRELQVPELPELQINVPQELQQLAGGLGFDINLNSNVNVEVSGPPAGAEGRREFAEADFADSREVESLVRSELQRFETRLRRELGANTDPRTTSTSGGGGTGGGRLI